jgi:hypothetical protein
MFEPLMEAIDDWEIPVDGAALVAGFALLDRLAAKLAVAVGSFDSAELWDCDGATSMVAWLRHHAGRSGRDAQVLTKTARRLGRLPVTAAAWAEGSLAGGQVRPSWPTSMSARWGCSPTTSPRWCRRWWACR